MLPGADVDFDIDGGVVRLIPVASPRKGGRGARIVAHLRGRGNIAMSTDQIMALTRGDQMTAVLVDSNVLLDIMTEDADWFFWSASAVEGAADRFRLVIDAAVYAEVSVGFPRIEDLDATRGTRLAAARIFRPST